MWYTLHRIVDKQNFEETPNRSQQNHCEEPHISTNIVNKYQRSKRTAISAWKSHRADGNMMEKKNKLNILTLNYINPRGTRWLTGYTKNRSNGCVHSHVQKSSLPEEKMKGGVGEARTRNLWNYSTPRQGAQSTRKSQRCKMKMEIHCIEHDR